MVFAALIGGIVGAKLWFIAENGGPLFSGTGLTFYGGLLGGALAVLAWAKYRGELDLQLRRRRRARRWPRRTRSGGSAASSPATATTATTGTGPWAMAYPNGTVPIDTPVHPTPIYETLVMGGVRAAAVALARPLAAGHAERHLPDRHGPGALPGRVRAPQRRRGRSG